MQIDLIDFETDGGDGGDGGGGAPEPASAPAAEPEAPPAPETPDAAEAAAEGPEYLTREDFDRALAEHVGPLAEVADYIRQAQYAQPPAAAQEEAAPLDLDPFSENFGENLRQLMREVVTETTQPVLGPIAEQHQAERDAQIIGQAFEQLQVPEQDHWRTGVLIAEGAFRYDQYGRPVSGQQSVRQGYEFLKHFAAQERADERAKIQAEADAKTQQLKAVAGAPNVPAGTGGVEGEPEYVSLRDAGRAALERINAAA